MKPVGVIKSKLRDNVEALDELIESLSSFTTPRKSGNYLRFSEDGENNNRYGLNLTSLHIRDFKTSESKDIFDFISDTINSDFIGSVNYVTKTLKLDTSGEVEKELDLYNVSKLAKEMKRNKREELYLEEFNEIRGYKICYSKLLLQDGISLTVQDKFGIGYCEETERVVIPYRKNGKVLGLIGRYNKKEVPNGIPKYLSLNNFSKSHEVFGLEENKETIEELGEVIIVESEKSVMRASSMDIDNVLAVGGCNISDYQALIINKLNIKRIILAFDEGLTVDIVKKQLDKFKTKNPFIPKKELMYLPSEYMQKGSKNCIFDESYDKVCEFKSKLIRGE